MEENPEERTGRIEERINMSAAGVIDHKAYRKLLASKEPHVIHSEAESQEFIAVLEALHSHGDLTPEEEALAELLTLLIENFEERYELEPATPVEVIKHLMDVHNLKQSDLDDVFGQKSVTSEVLSGRRELSKTHIARLSKRFNVSTELFFA
jgi:HTH-type transcriptional regulator/antitoxin HigA